MIRADAKSTMDTRSAITAGYVKDAGSMANADTLRLADCRIDSGLTTNTYWMTDTGRMKIKIMDADAMTRRQYRRRQQAE